jgi:hypothetical protein
MNIQMILYLFGFTGTVGGVIAEFCGADIIFSMSLLIFGLGFTFLARVKI